MKETSQVERADIKTRWKKGQSGNPTGRRVTGAGATLTGLARTMLERPVERPGSREPVTRLVEYLSDIVQRADAGDHKCRMFLLRTIDRGDHRKTTAQRNAKKTKNEDLRKFELEKADEISTPMPPLAEETVAEQTVPVSPTTPQRQTIAVSPKRTAPRTDTALASSAMFRRDPHTGNLMTPEGRVLSQQEEEQLLYPNWPHISPHLKKEEREGVRTGSNAGDSAGLKSPAAECQAIDSTRESGDEKILHENPPPDADRGRVH